MVATAEHDVIDQLAGIAEDSPVAALRRQKPDLVTFAQGSYNALLEPPEPGNVSLLERHAIAYRVGLLTGFDTVAIHHRDRLRSLGDSEKLISAIAGFPNGEELDARLAALLAHTDRVTHAPGTAEAEHIAALEAAGLTPTEIVTVAQLIGFLAYEVRAIAVARAFGEVR
jgi:CMD domain protein